MPEKLQQRCVCSPAPEEGAVLPKEDTFLFYGLFSKTLFNHVEGQVVSKALGK